MAHLLAAIYTQSSQNRLQRVAREVEKRETVYGDFVMSASNLLLKAYTQDGIVLGGDEQRLIGLINRMRLFAPPEIISGAEKVVKAIVEISLEPSIEVRQLAKGAFSRRLDADPLSSFSQICRADLDQVRGVRPTASARSRRAVHRNMSESAMRKPAPRGYRVGLTDRSPS